MSLYLAADQEALRARKYLKEWTSDNLLSEDQHKILEQETQTGLRTTNIFLRVVLFVFTLILVAAATGLFYVLFLSHPSEHTMGLVFLVCAVLCYAAAEIAGSHLRFFRHGIEEALAVSSVAFLCLGVSLCSTSLPAHRVPFLVPALGALLSLWIWRRFGLWYAFLAAIIFFCFLPGYGTSSPAAQHVIIAALYLAGLLAIARLRTHHRFDHLADFYSIAEALLWLGIYLAFNLKISTPDFSTFSPAVIMDTSTNTFARPFYWATWLLIWCLPPVIVARGLALRDRFVLAAGLLTALLTFVSNKPYLGWQRHTWDPILLGLVLTGFALAVKRRLARAPDATLHGFTAARLTGRDAQWIQAGAALGGFVSPHAITPAPQTHAPEVLSGGGASGGGGATRDF